MFYSPLRYPGGKNKLSSFVLKICELNNFGSHYVEPYAGGASVALKLLIDGYVKNITINDKDFSLYAFWYSVLNHPDELCKLISDTEINIDNWKSNRLIQSNIYDYSIVELGFSTLFLNRTNISGILKAGVIGGIAQKGNYKIDCRFNKKEIISKIKLISKKKSSINLYNEDAIRLLEILRKKESKKELFFYYDPPYYIKGSSLYLHHYRHDDHFKLLTEIEKDNDSSWMVSYDNVPQIKELYKEYRHIDYSLTHSAHKFKLGKEVLFFSHNIRIPNGCYYPIIN